MKKTVLLSLIMAVVMPVSAQKNEYQGFAFRLYDKVEQQNENPNCVMSPYSAQMALTLLANGLTEEAATELKTMMGVEEYSMQQLNEYSRESINSNLPSTAELEYSQMVGNDESSTPSAEIANAVFLNNSLTPNADFTNICATYYDGTVENLDFGSPYASEYIDNWANEKTHGLIPKLDLELSVETMMVLANATYFHGSWTEPFHRWSSPQAFHNADGSTSYVPTMHRYFGSMGVALEPQNVVAARLPYGYSGDYNMTIFKPMDNTKEMVLDYNLWKNVQEKMNACMLNIKMPLFTVDTRFGINDILRSLGATKIFTEACITGIANQDMSVSNTQQLARIAVDENGTTAAAITTLESNSGAEGEELDLTVDSPFYFTIDHCGEILFIGHISDLSSENVDAIKNIETKFVDDACYNLQGQRVVESQKGIVIRNGKKYINR